MKILMFGRGTIAALYGWAFEKAGHEVDFYVRPGRAAQFGPEISLEIRDGRKKGAAVAERWPVTLREELDAGHDYDLILLSVNPGQLDAAVEFLGTRVGGATVLMFGNMFEDPAAVVSALPADQVVWGFPGGGGGFTGSRLAGGVMKAVFLGFCDSSNRGARYRAVRGLFQDAGFSVTQAPDFRSWLWFHYILDAGLLAKVLSAGGLAGFLGSRAAIGESVLLVREMVPLLEAKGGTPRIGAKLMSRVPVGLLSFVLQKALGGDNMAAFLFEQLERTGQMSRELAGLYARDVLAEARRLGVRLPRLEALEPAFA
ncbi:ketopantoate reductase family protein [Lentzea sp.]|uniref:ketopantoate reductase family protein n=1 Tax=Lentzea sp. TaxID=56099 RepID=UPI002C134B6A|nr:2-dehydropantoate 2-reductase N-terminal domain-containing protein [Lentzea sp.]HUQ61164.1 2-dehydropantoate 2-reductase N-terminal domain-containing protein [Lentzea sp.]